MSGISSGVGLISGINTAQLIDQLINLERGTIRSLQARNTTIDTQRTALAALSASLLALRQSATRFDSRDFFRGYKSTSSDDTVLTALASTDAAPGTYRFRVHSLVTNHSVVSRGFADADQTPVGSGTLTIEVGGGRVDPGTKLSVLNGGAGVRRGVIAITDRAGGTAEIDLSRADTITDVLEAINNATGVNVRARVTSIDENGASGDRIVIEDLNDFSDGTRTPGRLVVTDRAGGNAAADLGISGSAAGARLDGLDVIRIDDSTPLSFLNDGNGVGRTTQLQPGTDLQFTSSAGDFSVRLNGILAQNLDTDLRVLNNGNGVRLGVIRLTDRQGESVEVDLADPNQAPIVTVADLRNRINAAAEAAGVDVRLGLVNSSFQVTDSTGVTGDDAGDLIVEDVSGFATADLGVAGKVASASIVGRDVYRVSTVGDALRAINYASGNNGLVRAEVSADGNGIVLTALDPTVSVQVSGADSTAARDLGLDGLSFGGDQAAAVSSRALLGGLNTVLLSSLRGGRGVTSGVVTLTDASGASADVDLTSARTLQDVIDRINAAHDAGTIGLTATINAAHNGIQLTDDSGGTGSVVVADQSGSLASDLGLAGTHALNARRAVNGGNAQLQYITENTRLEDFNNGAGVSIGNFTITDSAGGEHTVALSSLTTDLGGVIKAINAASGGAYIARVNDSGDGLVVIDQAGGDKRLTIEDEEGGRTARDLRLAGTAGTDEDFIDGSLEIRVSVGGRDTLRDLASRINNAGAPVGATIVNDGSDGRPFSLTLTSEVAGRAGELLIDSGSLELDFGTLSRARDAVVSVGGGDGAASILITGTSNTIEDAVPGLSLNLLSAKEQEVTVSVTEDLDSVIEEIRTFVTRYNDLQAQIDAATSFNEESLERGPLLGDRTVNQIRSRLRNAVFGSFGASGTLNRLSAIGIGAAISRSGEFVPSNNRIEFDEERFREVYAQSPERVADLIAAAETGFGAVLDGVMDELSSGADGLVAQRDALFLEQQQLLDDRIAQLEEQLAAKRTRLERQFAALESALASLQDQQTSLNSLLQLAANT